MKEEVKKSNLELTVELVKATAWPVLVIVVLCIYWKPLYQTINKLPDLIGNSESITIGELSIKIQKHILAKPSDKVKNVLSSLSANEIDLLMLTETTKYFHQSEVLYARQNYDPLIQKGVFVEIDNKHLSTDPNGIKYVYGIQPTDSGLEVRAYLMQMLSALLKEIT